jgi:response regulator RpfG family c-di-GMP phosphodiesterase
MVIVTEKTDPESLAMAFEAGAMDYITKPVREIELRTRIRSVLALKRETDARKSKEQDLLERNLELQRALREIRVLRGLIRICSVCKKIKTDRGGWQEVELYIREHSAAEFTHGICAECASDQYLTLDEGAGPADSRKEAGDDLVA